MPKNMITSNEKLIKLLVDKIRLGIVVIGETHKVIEANQRFADMLGYTLEEVMGLHTWEYENESNKDDIIKTFANISELDTSFETRHRRKDGTVFDVEINVTGTKIIYKGKEKSVVMCICQDISEKKLIQRQLLQSERKYKSFVENSADIIFTLNGEAEVIYISPNCKNILGYKAEELERQGMLELFLPDDREKFLSDVDICFKDRIKKGNEYRLMHKNKKIEWYSVKFSKIKNDNNDQELVCNARNITERKTYEIKLKDLSTKDQLTGAYNRYFFNKELNRLSKQNTYPISIIVFDLDNLKEVNDCFGHDEGDKLLKKCCSLIEGSLREGETLARVGGDEFIAILPLSTEKETLQILRKILNKIDYCNEVSGNKKYKLSLSAGIATINNPQTSVEHIIKLADARMYSQKKRKKL